MRKARHSEPNQDRWLVSYADFITLLFAFFVVMFATAQTDNSKTRAVSESVKKALQNDSFKNAFSMLLGGKPDAKGQGSAMRPGSGGEKLKGADQDGLTLDGIDADFVGSSAEGDPERAAGFEYDLARLDDQLYPNRALSFGGDEIAPDFYPTIQTIADAMNKVQNPARAEGHTDSVPIHTSRFRSNWELSAARSIALVEILTKFGVARERLSIAGYADTAPVDNNDTELGRQNNRRVDIVILNQTAAKGEPERGDQPAPPK